MSFESLWFIKRAVAQARDIISQSAHAPVPDAIEYDAVPSAWIGSIDACYICKTRFRTVTSTCGCQTCPIGHTTYHIKQSYYPSECKKHLRRPVRTWGEWARGPGEFELVARPKNRS